MLRCVSLWELLQQAQAGGPTDALLFSQNKEQPESAKKKTGGFFSLRSGFGAACTHPPTWADIQLHGRRYCSWSHLAGLSEQSWCCSCHDDLAC